ncbi:MAG: hypothetical protein WA066_02740 [Candidatus Omnitrophota bacterium]
MGKNIINGQSFTYDDKYSHKDFTGRKLLDVKDLNGITIFGSCFSQEIPDKHIFPDNMAGVTFINCNLDNVFIPIGNTVIGGSKRRFKVQKDARDWEINDEGIPVKVISEKQWVMNGFSVDPKDIPKDVINKQVITKDEYDRTFGKGIIPSNSLFEEVPQIINIETKTVVLVTKDASLSKMKDLKNVIDITKDAIDKTKLEEYKLIRIKAEIDYVEIEGKAKMFDDVNRIKKVI